SKVNHRYIYLLMSEYPKLKMLQQGAVLLGRLATVNCRAALTTAAHPEALDLLLRRNSLSRSDFNGGVLTVYDLEDPSVAKPNPHTIEKLMEDNNVEPNETFMVGDSKNDIVAAQRAGVTA